jgi:hypothetical protein
MDISVHVEDPNGDPFEVQIDQVMGLGDRYKGTGYVTSQPLSELSYKDGVLHILANTPGNYRLIVTVSDKDGEISAKYDLPVFWPTGANPWPIRGVAIDFWGPYNWHSNNLGSIPALIDEAVYIGANYIQFAPNWHTPSVYSSEIGPCYDLPISDRPCITVPDHRLRQWISNAHSQGLDVLLKPHLTVGAFEQDVGYDGDMWQIRPTDPEAWFESYAGFILHYAQIAEDEGVEMFSVGNELTGTQLRINKWREIIEQVREVYTGSLTYSDVLLWQTWTGQAWFWDDLDYIGIPYYTNGSSGNNYPTIDEMTGHIQSVLRTNLQRAMNSFPNPMIATEMGRPNFDGTNHDPWNWDGKTVDNQEVVDYMEAAFTTQLDLLPRFKGCFIWVLKPRENVYALDWDFRGKPLEKALIFWFSD